VPAPDRQYCGTADALYRNLLALRKDAEHVLILSADHIYEMDYRRLLESHVRQNADATLSAIVYPTELSSQFGILQVDTENRICGFEEKPARPREIPDKPGSVLANMGVYVFRKDVLLESLREDASDSRSAHDLGRNILPRLVAERNAAASRFEGYWKDVGTLDSYYDASLECHALSATGCVITDDVRIHRTAEVTDSILLPGVTVGPHARIHRAILDEGVHVMAGATIGTGSEETFAVSANGIVVVPAESVVMPKNYPVPMRSPALAAV
jgi:glucose-1-phosphate adenylyltransferase